MAIQHEVGITGFYTNSYNGTTFYTSLQRNVQGPFGFELGVASYGNYRWSGKTKLVPIGQLVYDYKFLRLGFVPAFSGAYKGIVTVQLKLPIQ